MAIINRFTGEAKIDVILRSIYAELNNLRITESKDKATESAVGATIVVNNNQEIDNSLQLINSLTQTLTALSNKVNQLELEVDSIDTTVDLEVDIPYTDEKVTSTTIYLGIASTLTVDSYLLSNVPLEKVETIYTSITEYNTFFNE